MRVLHVLNNFIPLKIAGTEIYTYNLCKTLQIKGIDVSVTVPNFGIYESEKYIYDGIEVFKYSEVSTPNRYYYLNNEKPSGLDIFNSHIYEVKPDIVHFHEVGQSNGITLHHFECVKKIGAKIVMTFHLSGYTCKIGSLYFKNKTLCDGTMETRKCLSCYLHTKGISRISPSLITLSQILHQASINTLKWNNKIGSVLGIVPQFQKFTKKFRALINSCDQVVVVAEWYRNILLSNGVEEHKLQLIQQGLPYLNKNVHFKTHDLCNKKLRVVFIGRISHEKGLHILIKAILGIDPNLVELTIYGNSDDMYYKIKLKEITFHSFNIKWENELSRRDLLSTLNNFDVLCLCSTVCEMSPLIIQ
jgi:glycosyltransferase involved in cell wall biosynthesis